MNYLVLERFQSDRKIYNPDDVVDFDDETAAVLMADGLIELVDSKPEKTEKPETKKSGKPESQTDKPAA
jgi:hypothetical protein